MYQVDRQHEALSPMRRQVIVRTLWNGRVQVVNRDQPSKWRGLPAGAVRKQGPAKKPTQVKTKTEQAPQRSIHGGGMEWERGGSFGMG